VNCKRCDESGLNWEQFGDKWKLVNQHGIIHTCGGGREGRISDHLRALQYSEDVDLLRKIHHDISYAIDRGGDDGDLGWLVVRRIAIATRIRKLTDEKRQRT
jgi:hypothetical protein